MDAIVFAEFGGPEVLEHKRVPKPVPEHGYVLISVKAFGVNHAEMHMRKGEWDEWNAITGLECVGIVEDCPGKEFDIGVKVLAVMGGMGRTIPGGYGEFVNVPASNVVTVATSLPWEALAAIPEVYSTAWTALFTILGLKAGDTLLVRGATSTIGQAAVNLAVYAGAKVTATTRSESRYNMLRGMGATTVALERPGLAVELLKAGMQPRGFDKTLNLVGNSVLLDSINLTIAGGRMLQAGWLGGLQPVMAFNPMTQMKSGVHFSLFHSKMLGTADFPLNAIPFQKIIEDIEHGEWDAKPAYVFEYRDIHSAHMLLDSQNAGGKIVVKH